jgi:hypothetical protein
LLERLNAADRHREAVPDGHESRLSDVEQQLPQPEVRDAANISQVSPEIGQPTPAIGGETTLMSRSWAAIVLTIFAWIIGQAIVQVITQNIGDTNGYTFSAIGVGVVIGTAVGGLCLGYISRLIAIEIRTKHVWLIAAGWAAAGLGWVVGYSITRSLSDTAVSGRIIDVALEALYGSIGGIITAVLLRQVMPALPSRVTYILPTGWGLGSILGLLIAYQVAQINYGPVFGLVYGAIAGAIGGGVMFWALSQARLSDASGA